MLQSLLLLVLHERQLQRAGRLIYQVIPKQGEVYPGPLHVMDMVLRDSSSDGMVMDNGCGFDDDAALLGG